METSVVTTKGQIVIPSKIRKRYQIKEGTKIQFKEEGNKIVLEPVTPDFVRSLRGSLKGTGVLETLMEERRKDRERENESR